MIASNVFKINKNVMIAVGAFVAAAIVSVMVASTSHAAGWTSAGTQVIKQTNGSYVSAAVSMCKVHQGSGNYKINARVSLPAAGSLSGYSFKIGSNLGSVSSRSTSLRYNARIAQTTTVTAGGTTKNNSTIRFTAYVGKTNSSGYTVYSGTTLRSLAVTSITTC